MNEERENRVTTLNQGLAEREREDPRSGPAKWKTRAEQLRGELVERYGYGDNAVYRLRAYDKVCMCVECFGKQADDLVRGLMQSSIEASFPDRFFLSCFLKEAERRRWLETVQRFLF